MILLQSLKTKFSLIDKGFLLHLCNRLYARHTQPNNYYSASRKLQIYLLLTHINVRYCTWCQLKVFNEVSY